MIARLCRCGHSRASHSHHRAGSDCAACDCPRWRWRRISRSHARREKAFRDMVRLTEQLRLYDIDPAEVDAALDEARRRSDG